MLSLFAFWKVGIAHDVNPSLQKLDPPNAKNQTRNNLLGVVMQKLMVNPQMRGGGGGGGVGGVGGGGGGGPLTKSYFTADKLLCCD